MKNLCSTFSDIAQLPSDDGRYISSTCLDPETERSWVTVEKRALEEGEPAEVELWYRSETWSDSLEPTARVTSFVEISNTVTAPRTLALKFLPEEQSLCLVLRSGEIALAKVDDNRQLDDMPEMEIVGEVESGLSAAAWSPDDEQLVLVTGEDKVIVMSRDFDVLYEAPLRTEAFGEDEQINVGWGSKRTQFHGSLGKAAAAAASNQPTVLPAAHPSDDGLPRITWRGDGQYFAISSLDRYTSEASSSKPPRRQVRVYVRSPCALSTTSEPIYGLGEALAWRPSGNLIASIKRYGYEGGGEAEEGSAHCEVIFLERNGLQHGSFELREDQEAVGGQASTRSGQNGSAQELKQRRIFRVRHIAWNSDSTVLAVWIEREHEDVVQLWTMNNYHYYLKQELFPPGANRFSSLQWHPEKALTLYLGASNSIQRRSFAWETVASRLDMPRDTGSVAVIDGARLLMTAFRTQNVPPPMSSYVIDLPSTPVHIAFSPVADKLAVLLRNGSTQVWALHSVTKKLKGPRGASKAADPVLVQEDRVLSDEDVEPRQIAIGGDGVLIVLASDASDSGDVVRAKSGCQTVRKTGSRYGRLAVDGQNQVIVLSADGEVTSLDDTNAVHLPSFCFDVKASSSHSLIFALDTSGKLYACSSAERESPEEYQLVASDCTSFTISPSFLVYTTSSHESKYAPLDILRRRVEGEQVSEAAKSWETRRVERGSQIVTVVPSAMALVLQMPRGNLETINPRPLVIEVLKRDILAGRYRAAFLACRKHRIDLNVIYDLDPDAFMSRLSSFVDQVPEVDYLNLFLSGLKQDLATMPQYHLGPTKARDPKINKINTICDAIREQLLQRDMVRYVDTILTSHVCKSPPDYEAGLRVLLKLRDEQPKVVEDAIRYIIFLTDVNKLFDVALGMYDFQLVLMVAQFSQKDPREYLPFLRELKSYDKYYQRFKIDDHLERRSKALANLHQAGPDRFEEATLYIVRYGLFTDALRIYKDEPKRLQEIRGLYGEHLFNQHHYSDAAMAFVLAGRPDRAMAAYERAHLWRELFALAVTQKIGVEEMEDMCTRVAEHLTSSGKYLEAAQVFLDYRRGDGHSGLEDAVHALCRGSEFAEAYRLTALHDRPDLVDSLIHTGLEDAQETLMDVFDEMEGQLDKEMNRIEELVGPGGKMETDPDSFFMIESEPALENVDIQTDATGTTAGSMFTRYTVARSATASAWSGRSRDSSSSRRKAKKKILGRKGTVGEWEYLVASLGRLAERVEEKTNEVTPLLPFLVLSSDQPAHAELASDLQNKVTAFRKKIQISVDKVWEGKEAVEAARHRAMFGDLAAGDGLSAGMVDALSKWREKEGLAAGPTVAVDGGGRPADGVEGVKLQTKPVLAAWRGCDVFC